MSYAAAAALAPAFVAPRAYAAPVVTVYAARVTLRSAPKLADLGAAYAHHTAHADAVVARLAAVQRVGARLALGACACAGFACMILHLG